MPNPLGPATAVGVCARCQSIDTDEPPAPVCQVCGATPDLYRVINLSQPAGFRTLYGRERDYDGTFDWTPRATRPKLGLGPVGPLIHANFETWSGGRTVYVINDNNGALFDFEQLTGETWMTRDAVSKVSPTWNPQRAAGPDLRALAAISPTDVMIAGIHNWPAGIFADPLRVEGRAALYSLGFMIRRTAAVRLDVSDSELKIGLRTTADAAGAVIGQIFISDTLENGAGYSTYLGQPVEFEALLRSLAGPDVLGRLSLREQPTDHGAACQTSCHDCMRDYSNLAYHSILDWRLGLDLAETRTGCGCANRLFARLLDRCPGPRDPAHARCPAGEQSAEPGRAPRRWARASCRHRRTSIVGRSAYEPSSRPCRRPGGSRRGRTRSRFSLYIHADPTTPVAQCRTLGPTTLHP